jgi:hypothetical protein
MGMSTKAWMTACLFSTWFDHFTLALKNHTTVSMSSPHLTLDVARRARAVELHLLTLPLHCSHAMQPLDMAILSLSKQHFVCTVMHGCFKTGTGGTKGNICLVDIKSTQHGSHNGQYLRWLLHDKHLPF